MDLNQITVPCTDYDASVAFYKTLGLTQIVHSPPHYARFETESGATFSLHTGESSVSNIVVYFEVDNVDAEVKRLKASGIDFESEPVDQEWLWREAYLLDPAGNRICIYHAGQNRRFPAWRIRT